MEPSEYIIQILENQLPIIQSYAQSKVASLSPDLLHNDTEMNKIFLSIYQIIPTSLRIQITENDFKRFCLRNRHRIFEQSELS
jgi:hypothetical protein